MNAILPEDMEEHTLDSMMIGETAWTTPWAMWVDGNRTCWLHPEYTAAPSSRGTVRMRVERHQDGYHVWPPNDEMYKPQRTGPSYVAQDGMEWIPVAQLHRPDKE